MQYSSICLIAPPLLTSRHRCCHIGPVLWGMREWLAQSDIWGRAKLYMGRGKLSLMCCTIIDFMQEEVASFLYKASHHTFAPYSLQGGSTGARLLPDCVSDYKFCCMFFRPLHFNWIGISITGDGFRRSDWMAVYCRCVVSEVSFSFLVAFNDTFLGLRSVLVTTGQVFILVKMSCVKKLSFVHRQVVAGWGIIICRLTFGRLWYSSDCVLKLGDRCTLLL